MTARSYAAKVGTDTRVVPNAGHSALEILQIVKSGALSLDGQKITKRPARMNARRWYEAAVDGYEAAVKSGDASRMKRAEENLRFWEAEIGLRETPEGPLLEIGGAL